MRRHSTPEIAGLVASPNLGAHLRNVKAGGLFNDESLSAIKQV
jgi:hypothetical protein